jgi:hypothetical protein
VRASQCVRKMSCSAHVADTVSLARLIDASHADRGKSVLRGARSGRAMRDGYCHAGAARPSRGAKVVSAWASLAVARMK